MATTKIAPMPGLSCSEAATPMPVATAVAVTATGTPTASLRGRPSIRRRAGRLESRSGGIRSAPVERLEHVRQGSPSRLALVQDRDRPVEQPTFLVGDRLRGLHDDRDL